MTIGIALLLIFGLSLVDKNGQWRSLVKAAMWMAGLCTLGIAIFAAYIWYDEYQHKHKDDAAIASCTKQGGTYSYGDLYNDYVRHCDVPLTPAETAKIEQQTAAANQMAIETVRAENQRAADRKAAESRARKELEALTQTAKEQAQADAEARDKAILDAKINSVSWYATLDHSNCGKKDDTEVEIGPCGLSEVLRCNSNSSIILARYFGPNGHGFWTAEASNNSSFDLPELVPYEHGIEHYSFWGGKHTFYRSKHASEELARQAILQHAYYELCTQ